MPQELIKPGAPPRALTLTDAEAREVQETFAENIGDGTITEFDLPRIKVNPGTALWLIPAVEGDQTSPFVEGVIVHARNTRAYYKSKDAGNVPPDCSSRDGVTGTGSPGGKCADCPLAEWDSAPDGGAGQACKASKQLFMLRGDSMFLEVVSLPPTSLKVIRQFFLKLGTQGVRYHQAIIRIDLEKAQNAQGKPYGKASMKFIRKLTPDEIARAEDFRSLAQSISASVAPGGATE